nr:VC0807 family protein [Burkholderia sp. D-99]
MLTVKPRAGLILELFVNLVLPWVAYRAAQPYFGETGALYASAVPPIIWSIVEFIRSRRVDAVAAIVLLGIALSIIGMALGGSPRTLLMRESLASGTIGIVFLLSLFRERPLIFYLARATVAREMDGGAAHFEAVWDTQPGLRQMLRRMTFIWGAFMTLEMLLRLWMVVSWPVERVLVVSPIIGYTVFGCLLTWTFWYRRRMRVRNSVHIPGRDGVTETAGR